MRPHISIICMRVCPSVDRSVRLSVSVGALDAYHETGLYFVRVALEKNTMRGEQPAL